MPFSSAVSAPLREVFSFGEQERVLALLAGQASDSLSAAYPCSLKQPVLCRAKQLGQRRTRIDVGIQPA